ncbi:MAG: MBL fold metallo-hydrolase [Flavobacteriaceae bacterium]|jgi:pyrroloquinoline quinone biosynthesis protein B
MKKLLALFTLILFSCCQKQNDTLDRPNDPFILVLGVAQDAGYPQLGCQKSCCDLVYKGLNDRKMVSSIALIDPISNESWIFDATPDFTDQVALLSENLKDKVLPNGIFLTHGHIGHYTGLMFLGREAMGANNMPVYAMPGMEKFLQNSGPWDQLVALKNIDIHSLKSDSTIVLNGRIKVTPVEVPHRDEYTETVGYIIQNMNKKALFLPDIDKWSKWNRSIIDIVKDVDIALLDATFFKNGEINRDMSEVPHPFVEESMELFSNLSEKDRQKIYFIHFNHTNPLLIDNSEAEKTVLKNKFKTAKQGMKIELK